MTTVLRRRPQNRLETPEVLLTALALLVLDAIAAVAVGWSNGDSSCQSIECRTNGVSTTRPWIGVVIGVAVFVLPVLFAWYRGRGLGTTLVVQGVAAAALIAWAASAIVTAQGVASNPPPVPLQPSERPCVAVTLDGKTCLTYSIPAPTTP